MKGHDGLSLAVALTQAQKRIEELRGHAEAMGERLGERDADVLAAWTTYLAGKVEP